jgi:xylulose-5-phosphate/fructose-6-phosphate phosphoketolase
MARTKPPARGPLSAQELDRIDAYWRAANYLSVGQIYLLDNPLLRKPLRREHIKPRLLGHWGTTPGLNFIYAHLNRAIVAQDLDMIYMAGPGHGGPAVVANAYLEGAYTEYYPAITQDTEGLRRLFKQFSFPGGIPSHAAPETPGSIHEGGELGYVLAHAFGAAFDNPDLIVAAVIGDGEAETGPLSAGWHGNKFLNPERDGAVLPILHLNGYKIANPCYLARIPQEELAQYLRGMGYAPRFVDGHEPPVTGRPPALRASGLARSRERSFELAHQQMAAAVDDVVAEIRAIQGEARRKGFKKRPAWPMIVLRSPKGWTCPKYIDGKQCEDYWRAHQVPMGDMDKPSHVRILEQWMKSYRPEELFDKSGRLVEKLASLPPKGTRRMSDNPHANGGKLLRDLRLPDFRSYAVKSKTPGSEIAEATRVMGQFLRDVMKINLEARNFRLFSPDENNSNRWQDVLDVTNRCYVAEIYDNDDHLSPDGRVMEVLSEHQCQGWLEGYLLTGRHGFFSSYEAFVHIVDSMFNQHAKWLKVCNDIAWRAPVASLNYLLSSHVWRQDHNGFSHQDPGFLDHVANKKAEVIRIYLPPDANCLLSVTDHCLRSRNYVNVVVAGKQPAPVWLSMEEAARHCAAGLGIWEWASSDREPPDGPSQGGRPLEGGVAQRRFGGGSEPDIVLGCCGDVPTLEVLGAVDYLRGALPDLKVRVINVVDLMKLQPPHSHPHGLPDSEFEALFTVDRPVLFAFHGYPTLVHKLTYKRANHANFHVRGFKEEGTTTTPFDMCVRNELDRFHLVAAVLDLLPELGSRTAYIRQALRDKLSEHHDYIREHGDDMPEVRDWSWPGAKVATRPRGREDTGSDNQ